jgi:hypothetical protein
MVTAKCVFGTIINMEGFLGKALQQRLVKLVGQIIVNTAMEKWILECGNVSMTEKE